MDGRMVILASNYGVSVDATPEVNRVGLLQAFTAASAARLPCQLPASTLTEPIRVGRQHGTAYALLLDLDYLEVVADPTAGSCIEQSGSGAGVSFQLMSVRGGHGYRFGTGGGLILSGAGLTSPYVDQNHLVYLLALNRAISDVYFDRVHFYKGGGGGGGDGTGGDGVKLTGQAGKLVTGAVFDHCVFTDNARSAISPNYYVDGVFIDGCKFYNTSDQHIDYESSGLSPISNVRVRNSHFDTVRQGNVAISMGGATNGNDIVGMVVEDCTFLASLQGGYTRDTIFRRCTFTPQAIPSVIGALSFFGPNSNMLFEECTFNNPAGLGNVPAVRFYNYETKGADGVVFRDCVVNQYANYHCVELLRARGVTFDGGSINYHGTVDATYHGISFRTIEAAIDGFTVDSTVLQGKSATQRLDAAVALAPDSGFPLSGARIDNIRVNFAKWGLATNGAIVGLYADEPMYRSAVLDSGASLITQSSVNAPDVVLAGERGASNVRSLTGWGTPENNVSGVIGCSYVDRSTGTTYYKTTGTPAAPSSTGWVVN